MDATSREQVNALRVRLANTYVHLLGMISTGVTIDSHHVAYAARDISQDEAAVQNYTVAVAPYT